MFETNRKLSRYAEICFRSSNTITFNAPADFNEHDADNVEVPDTSGDDLGVPVVIPPDEQTTDDGAATTTTAAQ